MHKDIFTKQSTTLHRINRFAFMSKKQVFQSLTVLLICLSCGMAIYTLLFTPLNIDGGFYLYLSEFLSKNHGEIIVIGYTPVAISIWTLLFNLFPNLSYEPALVLSVFVVLLNSFILTKILIRLKKFENYQVHFIFWLYTFLQFTMDGTSIILEPLTMLFALISVYLIIKKDCFSCIIAAVQLCSLSFMTKHYGAASLAVVIFIIFKFQSFKINSNFIFQTFLVLLSFLIATAVLYVINVYFLFSQIISPELIIRTTLNYGKLSILHSVFYFSKGLIQFIPLILIPIIFCREKMKLKEMQIGLIGILAFLPAFYFKQYHHYYLLILPFTLMVFANTIFSADNSKKEHLKLIITVVIVVLTIASNLRTMVLSEAISKKDQHEISKEIALIIPKNSIVFIGNSNLQPYRFLNKLNGPLMAEYGLGFPDNYSDEIQSKMIINSDYLLFSEKYQSAQVKLIGIINKSIYVYKNV